jgi:hypothetical protein
MKRPRLKAELAERHVVSTSSSPTTVRVSSPTMRAVVPVLHDGFDELESLDEVDAAVGDWRDAVRARRAAGQAWPAWINIPSKIGHVAAVGTLARERRADDLLRGILIAAVCPGLIDTGASRPWLEMRDARTPEQAVEPLLDFVLDQTRIPTSTGGCSSPGESSRGSDEQPGPRDQRIGMVLKRAEQALGACSRSDHQALGDLQGRVRRKPTSSSASSPLRPHRVKRLLLSCSIRC